MTAPSPETLEREKQKLYVTDAELIRRLGLPRDRGRHVLRELEARHPTFPKKQKFFGDCRYWPAVKAYLDALHGVISTDRRG